MYGAAKIAMEQGQLKIPDNEDLIRSLLSIQYERDDEGCCKSSVYW